MFEGALIQYLLVLVNKCLIAFVKYLLLRSSASTTKLSLVGLQIPSKPIASVFCITMSKFNFADYTVDTSYINPIEFLSKYGEGGFCPIHIGDRFQDGRYRILNKLGCGGFGTVWAARDHQYARAPLVFPTQYR